MIRLTDQYDDKPFIINPEAIKYMQPDKGGTRLMFLDRDDPIDVAESWQEVARKVLEYRLELINYQSYAQEEAKRDTNPAGNSAYYARKYLLEYFAGLEDGHETHNLP